MSAVKKLVPVLLATVWISLSEFVRNEWLLKSYWTEHYRGLGLAFPSAPVNGAMWGVWSLMLAVAIYVLARRFTTLQTTLLSWFVAFPMMWVVIGNLNVLPFATLWFAVPLSLLEAYVATAIVNALRS
jgi:hypothetical protein